MDIQNNRIGLRINERNIKINIILNDEKICEGQSINISFQGICGVFQRDFVETAKVGLDMELKEKFLCRAKATVIWSTDLGNDEFLIGFKFEAEDCDLKKYLAYVNELSTGIF